MIFAKKNAGKWVASKGNRVVASSAKLDTLMKKVGSRKDKESLSFDRVPEQQYFAGSCAVPVR